MASLCIAVFQCKRFEYVSHAVQVLGSNPSDVKALYRRAQAHLGQQDFVEAHVDIKAALQVCS